MNESETGRVRVTAFEEVPQIDLGSMFGAERQARRCVGDAVRDACTDVGFFYIRNHGVPQATVDETFRQMARFFALPEEVKRGIHAGNSRYFRGYSGLFEEQYGATTDYYEPHEVIDFGRENAPGDPPACEASLLYGRPQPLARGHAGLSRGRGGPLRRHSVRRTEATSKSLLFPIGTLMPSAREGSLTPPTRQHQGVGGAHTISSSFHNLRMDQFHGGGS